MNSIDRPDDAAGEAIPRSGEESLDERKPSADLRVPSAERTQSESAHKRVRGKPFDRDSAREAARLSAQRRRARQAEHSDPTDADIEAALAAKAARGDAKAAEMLLRWRAAVKPDEQQSTGTLSLDDMSEEELERCQARARHIVAVLEGIEEPTDDELRLLAGPVPPRV